MITAKPISFQEANEYVQRLHRHHIPVKRDKYRVGAVDENGRLVGIAQVGNPVARKLCDGETLEVVRCCSDGTQNVCSFLYSRCARIAKEMGYKKIITYILESEDGASLKASGWELEAENVGGGSWNVPSRPRETVVVDLFGETKKYPTEKKQRWVKWL